MGSQTFADGVSLAQFAAIQAGTDAGLLRADLLQREDLSLATWRTANSAWRARLANAEAPLQRAYRRLKTLATRLLQERFSPFDKDLCAWLLLEEYMTRTEAVVTGQDPAVHAYADLAGQWQHTLQNPKVAAMAEHLRANMGARQTAALPALPSIVRHPVASKDNLGPAWGQLSQPNAPHPHWQAYVLSQVAESFLALKLQLAQEPTERSSVLQNLELTETQYAQLEALWQRRLDTDLGMQSDWAAIKNWLVARNDFLRAASIATGFPTNSVALLGSPDTSLSVDSLGLWLWVETGVLVNEDVTATLPPTSVASETPLQAETQSTAPPSKTTEPNRSSQPYPSTLPVISEPPPSSDWNRESSSSPPSSQRSQPAGSVYSTLPAGTTIPPATTVPPVSTHPAPSSLTPDVLDADDLPPIIHPGHLPAGPEPLFIRLDKAVTLRPLAAAETDEIDDVKLEQFASLCAELTLQPEKRERILQRYSINTETEWEALKVRFDEGLRTDAEQRSRFNDLLKTYSIYLQESLNRDTSPLPNESDHGTQDQT